jgi:tetratricopeptide (TPR) repeat protein
MKKTVYLSLLLVFSGIWVPLLGQSTTISEEQMVMKTYPFSGPEPTPIMIRSTMWGRGPRLYPYFFFNKLSYEGVEQSWNVVRMENPYIEALILPHEGGKIMAATEKSTGKDFLYYNHVRKFRQIALRGPWTSGGLELNFGIVGHSPSTATPIDYVVRENADGSVSCTVGNMDLPSRTHWRVTFTLHPDKAFIDSKTIWYNPQPLNQSYYVWMTGANKLTEDLEFIYPGTAFIGHNYDVPERPWPFLSDGRNLALFKEHDHGDPQSVFIHGTMEDFAGCYWHDSAFGSGHWALHEDLPGQKFFRWRLSRAGYIWEDLLTDSDGQYWEPQMGRLLDQNDHEFFAPYSVDQWREIWFPFKEIGPMVDATPFAALNARRKDGSIVIGINALQKIEDELTVYVAGEEVLREQIQLKPMEIYKKEIPEVKQEGEIQVALGNKLFYTDDRSKKDLSRPLNFRNYEETSTEGLYQAAEREDRARNFSLALDKYLEVLEREPLHLRALTRVAELYCRRADYETALRYAHKALDYVMYDPDANYIYGVISRRMGNLLDAKETLGWAARSMKHRASAYCQIAELYLMEGKLDLAREYLQRSLEYNTNNIQAHLVLATLNRIEQKREKAEVTLKRIIELDPLNHFARFEAYLLDSTPENLKHFRSLIRNELPHETYLEVAIFYANLGLVDDALRLLEIAPEHPTALYWQAFLLREESPERSRQLLSNAGGLSAYLVFPYREESVPVFQWAADQPEANWKADYYLGLIYWGLRRIEDALKTFEALRSVPDYAPFYVSRAFLSQETNPHGALDDYVRAKETDPADWRNWHHLARYLAELEKHEEALTVAVKAAEKFPDEDLIKVLLARSNLNSGRFEDCYKVLGNATILPFEGQRDIHTMFVQCQLGLALQAMKAGRYTEALNWLEGSREFPERLGSGKPHNPDHRVQDYLSMICYEALGKLDEAEAARTRIYDYASFYPKKNSDVVRRKVDLWRDSLPEMTELDALESLHDLVVGERRRR